MPITIYEVADLLDELELLVYCRKLDLDISNDQEEFILKIRLEVSELLNLEIPK